MYRISTFVFVDLSRKQETTGPSRSERDQKNVAELAMIAAHHGQILSATKGNNYLVYDKLLLYLHLEKIISHIAMGDTPPLNDNLEAQRGFDVNTVLLIKQFLNRQDKPVCLVVHGGKKVDFTILHSVIDALPNEYCCVNSEDMFRELDPIIYKKDISKHSDNRNKRKYSECNKSYELEDIYERRPGKQAFRASSAEDNCEKLLESSIVKGVQFVEWCNKNNMNFSSVPQVKENAAAE